MQVKGFRLGSRMHDLRIKELAIRAVSREARGFLFAGFFGGLCGGVVGGFFAFGLGAAFF